MARPGDDLLDPPACHPAMRPAAACAIGTLLLHILDDEAHAALLDPAIALAHALSAHLSCVHVTPSQAYVAFARFGGVFVLDDVMREIDERNLALQARIEQRLAAEPIGWDFVHTTADVAGTLVARSALADLAIVGRDPPRHDYVGPTIGFLGSILLHSHTPLLVPSRDQRAIDPGGTAFVAWDGSIEAANAIRAALPLLRMAKHVRLHGVVEGAGDKRKPFAPQAAVDFLARHGICADYRASRPPSDDAGPEAVSAQLVVEALGADAQYLVMGGYGHSRVAEVLFGGVTRRMLEACPLALLLSR